MQLCGDFAVEMAGRRIEGALPARQGRLLVAYLTVHGDRALDRDELMDAVWGEHLPPAASSALSALLSKTRRTFGDGVVQGRARIRLALPPGSWVDVQAATDAIHRAESAVAADDWDGAYAPALCARTITARRFLAGLDASWIDDWRRRLHDVLVRSLECLAASQLVIGGVEIAIAEQAARELIERVPYREAGYRLMMRALTAKGNVAEALQVYEEFRIRLRDELGVDPGPSVQALHLRLLRSSDPVT
jgi:DNA-binding SARP family transcriptional activator